jgi:hypothetical protein
MIPRLSSHTLVRRIEQKIEVGRHRMLQRTGKTGVRLEPYDQYRNSSSASSIVFSASWSCFFASAVLFLSLCILSSLSRSMFSSTSQLCSVRPEDSTLFAKLSFPRLSSPPHELSSAPLGVPALLLPLLSPPLPELSSLLLRSSFLLRAFSCTLPCVSLKSLGASLQLSVFRLREFSVLQYRRQLLIPG